MRLQDFQSSKCSYQAHIPFSVTWSEDDFIGMATVNGVYITEFRPSKDLKTPTLSTLRYFVPCSKSLPTRNCGINIEDLIKELDQKSMYDLLQDITMSPSVKRNNAYVPAVKYIGWSPVLTKYKFRSQLAIITDSGSLDIIHLWGGSWIFGASVSKLWLEHCSAQWKSIPKEIKEILKELKARTYKVKFSAFSWGASRSNSCYDLFVSSYDGTLSMWSVNQNFNVTNKRVHLLAEIETHGGLITALHCQYIQPQKYVLFICYIDGRITSLLIDINDENIGSSKENVLWDEKDKIQIYPGGLLSRMHFDVTSSILKIVLQVVKGRHILLFLVDLDGNLMLEKVVCTEELFITGLATLSQTESLVTGYSGTIYHLVINNFEPVLKKLHDSFRTNHYACNGLALSRSKCIAVLPFSVKTNYDHLAMKELCHMLYCSLHDAAEIDDIFVNHSGSLAEIKDVIEIFRIESILKGSSFAWHFTPDVLDTMESDQLKKNLALLQLSILLENYGSDENGCYKEEKIRFEKEIQDLLISCHVFKKISYLMTKEELSTFEKKSLFIMKNWIDYVLTKYSTRYKYTSTTAASLKEQLNECNIKIISESCTICGNEIPEFTGPHAAVCKLGHTVPRCSLSLIQCTEVPYYSCCKCNVVADINAVSDKDHCCLFCDNTLRLSEVIISEEEIMYDTEDQETQNVPLDSEVQETQNLPLDSKVQKLPNLPSETKVLQIQNLPSASEAQEIENISFN